VENPDLKTRLKAMAQPWIETADAKFQEQVERHITTTVEASVKAMMDDRLAVLERAIADLERRLRELEEKA
jgi:hypothetical protein